MKPEQKDYIIEKNIPLPPKQKKGGIMINTLKQILINMEVGDSFLMDIKRIGTFNNAKKLLSHPKSYTWRRVDEIKIRIYKIKQTKIQKTKQHENSI